MKCLSLVVGLVAAFVVSRSHSMVVQDRIRLKEGDRIVFLGDSITQEGNIGAKGYVNLIRKHLYERYGDKKVDEKEKKRPEPKIECIGAGISGNKVGNLRQRVDRDVVARKPTIVFVYIGINDVWHGENNPALGTPPEKFEEGLNEVIGKIEKGGAKVILCTPTVIGELKDGANKLDKKLDEYAAISRKVAKERNVTLCDLRKAFVDYLNAKNDKNANQGILTRDRVHLSEKGNEVVAEAMLKAVSEK